MALSPDPRTRIGLLFAVGLAVLALDRPASLGLMCLVSASPLLFAGLDRRWIGRGALIIATVVWSTTLSQGLFYNEQPRVALVELGPLTLWREGVTHGLVQSLRLLSVSLAGLALALTTSTDRMFAALLRLRVPFGLAFLVVTALRFVPEVGREWTVVRSARARRGRPAWRRAPWEWLALEVSLLRPLVARSLRRAHALAESLDARGFDPLAPRAVRRPLVLAAWEPWALVLAFSLAFSLLGLRVLYLLYTGEVLYVPELRGLYGLVRLWL